MDNVQKTPCRHPEKCGVDTVDQVCGIQQTLLVVICH